MSYRVIEICAGAGGQALGLELAGFEHALAVELDATAAATLVRNRPSWEVAVGDVADPDVWDPRKHEGVDLLAGGVPCPPFSIAGRQLGANDERDLFAWAVETAGVVKPRALLLENVRGLSGTRFSGYRQAVLDRLDELGYWADWRLLQASDYGVPQLRPRFVLVALAHEYAPHFSWPEPAPAEETVGSTLLDLMGADGWSHAEDWAELANDIAPTIVGGSKKHGGADLGPTRAKAAWKKLAVDGHGVADAPPTPQSPSPALKLPRLTNEMLARLQGWHGAEYEWAFAGRKTATYRQIGNAFPPPVARAVGSSIAAALAKAHPTRRPDLAVGVVGGELEVALPPVHDSIYRLLRDAHEPLTLQDIITRAPDSPDPARVIQQLEHLKADFELHEVEQNGVAAYALGEFRAFRGQDDHDRHRVFASKRTRSTIS